METEPVRRILERQLQRIAAAGDTDGTATASETEKGRHMAAGARRLLQRGTMWATEADIKAAAKTVADERRAKENEYKRARRKRAAARNAEPHGNDPAKATP